MSEKFAARPPHELRRKDRGMEDETWIRSFLHEAAYGALATVHEGQPFINTNLFVYDEDAHAIYLHTARFGRTRANTERDPRACFSATTMGRLLPDERAKEFSVEYAGVTIFGTLTILEDPEEVRAALQKLMDKYAPHLKPDEDYITPSLEEMAQTTTYCLSIDAWSGKRKQVAEDFPGAYRFKDLDLLTSND